MVVVEFDVERGRAIAARRRAIGLSQRAAARDADLSNTAWARYEQGEPMAASSQTRVEEVLGLSLDELPAADGAETSRPIGRERDLRRRVERLEHAVTVLAVQLRETLEADEARSVLDELIGDRDDPSAASPSR